MSERLVVTHEPPTHPDQIWAHSPLGYALFGPVIEDGELVDALILYYNAAGAAAVGRQPIDLIGQMLSAALSGITASGGLRRMQQLWRTREPYENSSLYADDRALGTFFTTAWVADPHICMIFHDTTPETRKFARALRENIALDVALKSAQQALGMAETLTRAAEHRGEEVRHSG